MKEIISVVIFALFCLFGMVQCTAPSKLDIRIAEYICKDHDGLYERNRIAVEHKVVVCNDGSTHSPAKVVIQK